MTSKPSPSRMRALAAALRDLRKRTGMTTRDAAERIGISPASLNRTEHGTRMPSIEEVSALLVVYDATPVEREKVLNLVRTAAPAGWWETGGTALPRQLPTLITFESQADRIIHFQPLIVPGLLQTQAYMWAVTESSGVAEDVAEGRVAARAGRQTMLSRRRPPRYLAIIDEAVFSRPFGGHRVMAQQIRHIRDMAELPNITVQVIPFHRGCYPIYGPYVLLQFNGARDIVHLEHKQASGFLDEPDDTAPFQSLTDTLKVAALEPAATLDFLAETVLKYER